MPLFDKPLEDLRNYQAPDSEPADFDAFWRRTLAETARLPVNARFERVDEPIYEAVTVYDVTFAGFGGHPIRGWFLEPTGTSSPRPVMITFIGYGGGRSLPVDHTAPLMAGFSHFVMDTRGQGGSWSPGDTPDPVGGGNRFPGFLTQGIESPEDYYYRRVYTDTVRAVEAIAGHPHVDAGRIAVGGGSQGGGLAIAAGALAPDRVKLVMADVPFLCHFRRSSQITDQMPTAEIARYLKVHRGRTEQVFATLAYFDGVNLAPRIQARCLFSVGLMDMICPPSTVFAAYNRVRAPKEIRVYDYNEHEGGGPFQLTERLRFARQWL